MEMCKKEVIGFYSILLFLQSIADTRIFIHNDKFPEYNLKHKVVIVI